MENGEPYPATSIRSLLSGIQRVLQANKVPFNLFDKSDLRFRDIHMTLDTVSVSIRKEGVGTEVKHANVISMEDEDSMWEKGVIDTTSPWALLRAAFYTVGLHFSLRGGQEHRDFKVSQLSRVPLTACMWRMGPKTTKDDLVRLGNETKLCVPMHNQVLLGAQC